MGLVTKAPTPLVCHPHQKHSDTTETSLLDGLPTTERVLRAGFGTSQALEIITQQPWVIGMGLAKIPSGSLGYSSLDWEAGQGHLEPPHTPHPQRLLEVGITPLSLSQDNKRTQRKSFLLGKVLGKLLGHVDRGC